MIGSVCLCWEGQATYRDRGLATAPCSLYMLPPPLSHGMGMLLRVIAGIKIKATRIVLCMKQWQYSANYKVAIRHLADDWNNNCEKFVLCIIIFLSCCAASVWRLFMPPDDPLYIQGCLLVCICSGVASLYSYNVEACFTSECTGLLPIFFSKSKHTTNDLPWVAVWD